MNNNIIKKGIVAFFILAFFIVTGYVFVSFKNTEYISTSEEDTQIYNHSNITESNNSIHENTSLYYILENKNNLLCLYEVNGDKKTLLKSSPVNIEFLPTEDVSSLNKGIIIPNIEEGYQLIEDFTS